MNHFQCGGRLFKVPHWQLKKYCPVLLRLAEPNTDGTGGTSDDTAIPIDDLVSVEELVLLLDFFYCGFVPLRYVGPFRSAYFFLSILRNQIPNDEWFKLLVISSKLACEAVRARAINELTTIRPKVSPIDRIELGTKCNVPQWLPEAYADAFIRESPLTKEEGEKLGLEITVKVLRGREKCRRSGWSQRSSGDRHITKLVEEIFPPPKPEPQKGKVAGKSG